MTRIALAATAAHPGLRTVAALRTRPFVRDSVGLTGNQRERNIAGRVRTVVQPLRARSCWSTTS